MPQSRFGEEMLPNSINIAVSWSFAASSGSYTTSSVANRSGSWNIIDDGYGNLLVSGSNYLSVYGQYVGGIYTNYTSSVTKPIVGEWPLDNLYKYVDIGSTSFTSSFNKGFWQMESIYTNINVTTITGSVAPNTSDIDMLGAVMYFTASNSSSIQIKPNVVPDRNVHYNFENGDYSISMMVKPTQEPTHPSGSILLTKQGAIEELRIDENGKVHSQPTPNKFPYRLSYTSGSKKVMFEKSSGLSSFALTSSVSMSLNTLYHIVATKTGSLITLHVNSLLTGSKTSGSTTLKDSNTSNLSNIVVGNNLTVVGNTAITGNTTITGDLTVTGNITLDVLGFDDLHVNGSANIANTLTVAGISTFTGVATMANANVAILSGTSNTAIYNSILAVEARALAFSIALG